MGLFSGKTDLDATATVLAMQLKNWQAESTETVPQDRTPRVGQVLPVTVSRSDPAKVTVDWKRAPSLTDMARAGGRGGSRRRG